MRIGVPKEIKNREYRVGLTPDSVREFVAHGHDVVVETAAGGGVGATDQDYIDAGAKILATAAEVFESAEMIVKVKEPQAVERAMLRPHHLLYTYLPLAPDPEQTEDLIKSGATCIAYETVTAAGGGLPLLKPMSEVAGRMSVLAGAHYLQKATNGAGVLVSGVPGVAPANVVVIGGGVVGFNAAEMAVGLQANVTILDRNLLTLERINHHFGAQARALFSTSAALSQAVAEADLVIGAVLIPGANAPKLVTTDMIKSMKPGSVVVDVAIDQGGCFETSKATTHDDPVYEVDGVVHYCVANMPGAYARTSAYALNNATLPFGLALADKGWKQALRDDAHLAMGLNVWDGKITNEPVAMAQDLPFTSLREALARSGTDSGGPPWPVRLSLVRLSPQASDTSKISQLPVANFEFVGDLSAVFVFGSGSLAVSASASVVPLNRLLLILHPIIAQRLSRIINVGLNLRSYPLSHGADVSGPDAQLLKPPRAEQAPGKEPVAQLTQVRDQRLQAVMARGQQRQKIIVRGMLIAWQTCALTQGQHRH